MGFYWFLNTLETDRWARQALEEQKLWISKFPNAKFWLHGMLEILDAHEIPHNAVWSHQQHAHYWKIFRTKLFNSMENGNFISTYNKFTEHQWLQAVCGGFKWFGVTMTACPACGGDPGWDHIVLRCPMVFHETINEPIQDLLSIGPDLKFQYSRLIQKRWKLIQKRFM